METDRIQKQITFLMELDKLKTVYRRIFLAADHARKENDAEHMRHISVMALVLQEYCPIEIDINRVIRLLLVHDVVEIDAGDVSVYLRQNNLDLAEQEHKAAYRLFGMLPEDQYLKMLTIWHEFEDSVTPESRYANIMDRMEPLLQNYYTQGKRWQEDRITYDQVMTVNQKIGEVSPQLWEYAQQLINDSLVKGYLKRSY